ncbi:MAG: PQQ-dependent sugar dehydrogenase [Limisphaerales bacterium]
MKLLSIVPIAALYLSLTCSAEAASLPKVEMRVAYPELKFERPLWLCEAPDGTGRIFVAQQGGKVLILPKDRNGKETKLFLDLSDRKPWEKNEEGLLGFAFHPKFKSNRKFYVYYSQQNPKRSVISEFLVSIDDPDQANKFSERIIMEVEQPDWNHNGGQISFDPDGYLYITLGDGGGHNDKYNTGQKPDTLLAKILRIDVDSRSGNLQYGIPKDNPFLKNKEFRPETWAWGLRNVWRFSFDRKTGELYAADVGQNKWEEINIIKKGGNYGWSFREGFHEFGTNTPPVGVKFEDPILEYPHTVGQTTNHTPGLSVTGGYVYRGNKIPALRGVYLYGDFVFGTLWGLRYEKGKVTTHGVLVEMPKGQNPPRQIASFGEDGAGEVYVLAYDGRIYELEAAQKVSSK